MLLDEDPQALAGDWSQAEGRWYRHLELEEQRLAAGIELDAERAHPRD
jgi:hypothetical protein